MKHSYTWRAAVVVALLTAVFSLNGADQSSHRIAKGLELIPGAVNGAILRSGDSSLAIYGDPSGRLKEADKVLFTHHRRDVVWAGRELVERGAEAIVPAGERSYFEDPRKHWDAFMALRLKDSQQQTTKMITRAMPVSRGVKGGQSVQWKGHEIRVLDTPGFTRNAVSYLLELEGKKIAFTGDLIYGDGQIFDLYSFQDKIEEAKIGGYHGYGARLAQLITSLRAVAAEKPDMLIPARGPLIENPQAAIAKLISRVQTLYRNYLSTNALYWYFGAERMEICAERILGADAEYSLMPHSHYEQAPDWLIATGTTRILVADNGSAFMLDCGSKRYIDFVKKLMEQGLVKKIEGIFVTHYHGDHTHFVQAAAAEFDCPVYSTKEYEDILENPEAYHMAAMTPNAIAEVQGMESGQTLKWRGFELTFEFFPGQAYYHGALLVKKPGDKTIFFIGDAFTPSGIDDYCVLNRNLLHEDTGYLYCFDKVRSLGKDVWLVNEHVDYIFQFTPKQLDYLETRYRKRIEMLRELFPWDDPNYGVDEQWAWFYPYSVEAKPGERMEFEFRLWNHSPEERTITIRPNLPEGMTLLTSKLSETVPAGGQAVVPVSVYLSRSLPAEDQIITADVYSEGIAMREWAEAIVMPAKH